MGLAHLVAILPGAIIGLAVAFPAFLAGLAFAHRNLVGFVSLALAVIAAFGLIAIALSPYLDSAHTVATGVLLSLYPLVGLPAAGFIIAGLIDGFGRKPRAWPGE